MESTSMKNASMYIGQYIHSIDLKNRVFLPARFRNKQKSFVITKGLEGCLYLYDIEEWGNVLKKLEALSMPDKTEERAFKRALLSGAHEVEPDSQGRILIPQTLCFYAGVKSETIIIGVGVRLELWDKKKWDKYYKLYAGASFKKLASKLEI
jgi:MraZ protein